MGFPGGSDSKPFVCSAGDLGSIPGLGRSPGEGNGNPLQYSCLENFMDGEAWWATVHGVTNNQGCNGFRWTAKGLGHTYTCIHSPQTPLPSRLPHNVDQNSTCYTIDFCWSPFIVSLSGLLEQSHESLFSIHQEVELVGRIIFQVKILGH